MGAFVVVPMAGRAGANPTLTDRDWPVGGTCVEVGSCAMVWLSSCAGAVHGCCCWREEGERNVGLADVTASSEASGEHSGARPP